MLRYFGRALGQKTTGLFVSLQEHFHLPAQRGIPTASLLQKSSPFFRWFRQGGVKNGFMVHVNLHFLGRLPH